MSTYNWDLIERLLHEVQNGEGSFAPRKYAEQEAERLNQLALERLRRSASR